MSKEQTEIIDNADTAQTDKTQAELSKAWGKYRSDARAMARRWAFYGMAARRVFPKGYKGNNPDPRDDPEQYAFWTTEEGLKAFCRDIAAPGQQQQWGNRLRHLLLDAFRDGAMFTDAECALIRQCLRWVAKVHKDKLVSFEMAA